MTGSSRHQLKPIANPLAHPPPPPIYQLKTTELKTHKLIKPQFTNPQTRQLYSSPALQPRNLPTYQPIWHRAYQLTKPATNKPTDSLTHQSANTNQSTYHLTKTQNNARTKSLINEPTNSPTYQLTNSSTDKPTKRRIHQIANPSIYH